MVGPRGLVRGRWYGAGAIALALARYAKGETTVRTRGHVSPSVVLGNSAHDRWVTLIRWVDAARGGGLFAIAGLGELARRQVAEQVVLALAGRAGRDLGGDLTEAAFAGAAIAV